VSEQERFRQFLKRASETVAKWPAWKRNCLRDSLRSEVSVARPVQEIESMGTKQIDPGEQPTLKPRRVVIDDDESPWIPVSQTPLPESGKVLASFRTGTVHTLSCDRSIATDEVVAWMPLPDPYAPPEPEKRERFIIWQDVAGRWHETLRNPHKSHRQAVEHRDGDVDPDAARRARNYAAQMLATQSAKAAHGYLQTVLDMLEGRSTV
jgi:hypothetical protein